ncbi:MAG TPA: SDR family oxidoreductase [Pyrinomonadaceae bacterium]|nr:SDR family oxidoreductase [Pyrinomonadaceae bacterium]
MRILVFGAGGMLGHKVIQAFTPDSEVWGTVRGSFADIADYDFLNESHCIGAVDITEESSTRRAVEAAGPQVVINAIGIVKQQPLAKNVIATLTVNSIFPHRLSQLSDEFGFRLITISTDCVFDGKKGGYTERDTPNPTDLYGKSKELGEVVNGRALTIRTSIIGRELAGSHGLVEWFLSNRDKPVNGFQKAIYSGFPTIDLADIIRHLVFDLPELNGLYHVSSDPINKYDLLKLVNKYFEANITIEPSDQLQIDRSLDSSRFRDATGFVPKTWEEMIQRMAADPTPYDKWR